MIAATTNYDLPPSVVARLRPKPAGTVSEWADRSRQLDAKISSEPGRWHTSRVLYLREIMDAFADPAVGQIIVIKCSRMGGTELINNLIGYTADARPMPIMYVLPRETDVADEFSGRIRGVFEQSEALAKHIPGGTWCTADQITLDTLAIYGGWASSPGTLIRKTCGAVFFDEVDNCQAAAGALGNTWELVADRLATYGYRAKHVGVTTPTHEGASGWQIYQQSDRRQFFVPCPLCGGYQTLRMDRLKWPAGATPDAIELDDLAHYECDHCNQPIACAKQPWMIARGLWMPHDQHIEEALPIGDSAIVAQAAAVRDQWRPSLAGDAPRTRRRGYWINSFYSPWRTWSQIAAKFLTCKDDPERLRTFKNSWMAQPWANAVESPEEKWLTPKIVGAREATVPAEAKLVLVTADVQKDTLYYVARAWGAAGESWLVEAGTIGSMEALYVKSYREGWPTIGAEKMAAYAGLIDSGYRTEEVYAFVRERRGMVAGKGYESRQRPVERSIVTVRDADNPLTIWLIHTTLFKSKLSRLMKSDGDKPGAWRLNADVSDAYLSHLTSEHFVEDYDKNGRKRWSWTPKQIGRPNHWLDCEVYQLALAEILEQEGELSVQTLRPQSPRLRLIRANDPPPPDPAAVPSPTPPMPKPRQISRVTGGWQGRR